MLGQAQAWGKLGDPGISPWCHPTRLQTHLLLFLRTQEPTVTSPGALLLGWGLGWQGPTGPLSRVGSQA